MEEVNQDAERAIGRKEAFKAAQATGYEPVPPTGDKEKDKHIAEGQRLGTLRVLPASSDNPTYISQLSKNPEAIERQRQRLGLSQAASSSAGPTITERRNYLESLNFTKLKERAKSLGIRIPSGMKAADKSELIDKILNK